jgi:hypothetical protein
MFPVNVDHHVMHNCRVMHDFCPTNVRTSHAKSMNHNARIQEAIADLES